jgi:hypothetical protein
MTHVSTAAEAPPSARARARTHTGTDRAPSRLASQPRPRAPRRPLHDITYTHIIVALHRLTLTSRSALCVRQFPYAAAPSGPLPAAPPHSPQSTVPRWALTASSRPIILVPSSYSLQSRIPRQTAEVRSTPHAFSSRIAVRHARHSGPVLSPSLALYTYTYETRDVCTCVYCVLCVHTVCTSKTTN